MLSLSVKVDVSHFIYVFLLSPLVHFHATLSFKKKIGITIRLAKFTILFHVFMSTITLSSSYYDDYFLSDSDPGLALQDGQRKAYAAEDTEWAERPTGYICGLCVIVDEEFSKAYNIKEPTALKKSITKLVDHANWIFRTVDWNGNGRPDNIGFKTVKISYGWKPYKKETTKHYDTPKPALQLLKIFARLNFTKCCLGVGFTNRPFMNGLDGISFAASDRLLGGICDHRNPHEDFMVNMNVALISGRTGNTSQLTFYQLGKALIHELSHAFGVHSHDNDYKDPVCWGFRPDEPHSANASPKDGRFIMWESSPKSQGHELKKNMLRFSPCSKSAIWNVVSKRKNREKCFELDFNPFCGNGIVEGLEACDCGNEYDCSQQKCCGSRKSETPCVWDTKNCVKVANKQQPIYSAAGLIHPVRWFVFVIILLLPRIKFQKLV